MAESRTSPWGTAQITVEYQYTAQSFPFGYPGFDKCERGLHTLEAGSETGSNAKWLIRRSCRRVLWRVLDISFNFSASLPDIACDEDRAESIFAGSISSLTDANRTAEEPSAFLGSTLVAAVSFSRAVEWYLSEN